MLMAATRGKSSQPKRAALKWWVRRTHSCVRANIAIEKKKKERKTRENNNNNIIPFYLCLPFPYRSCLIIIIIRWLWALRGCFRSSFFLVFCFLVFFFISGVPYAIGWALGGLRTSVLVRRRWWIDDGGSFDVGWNSDSRPKMTFA